MHFNFYDKRIIAPAKMGSRYMDSIYGVEQGSGLTNTIVLPKGTKLTSNSIPKRIKVTEIKPFLDLDLNGVKWIIIRPPRELLKTALHTELILNWTLNPNKWEESVIIDNFTYSDWECGHYQWNLYKQMFLKVVKDYPDIQFVELENLSLFCDSIFTKRIEYDSTNYDFKEINRNFIITKDTCMDYLKLAYPEHYTKLMKGVVIEEFFYDMLINSKMLLSRSEIDINYQKHREQKFL
jgi:hypothetical protein